VRFYWAAQVATGTGAAARYSVLERDVIALKSGDRFQFYISPVTSLFAYVIHQDAAGALSLLHPSSPGPATPLVPGASRYLPSRTRWFELDQTRGTERIYVLASATQLSTLEAAMQEYAAASESRKAVVAATVLDVIGRLRKEHGQLEQPPPRPVTIAGSMRAAVPDLSSVAAEVSAIRFYARTYIIDHR
jgi:hypothetical protein